MVTHTVQEGHYAGEKKAVSIKEKVNIAHVVFVYGVPGMCCEPSQMMAQTVLWNMLDGLSVHSGSNRYFILQVQVVKLSMEAL